MNLQETLYYLKKIMEWVLRFNPLKADIPTKLPNLSSGVSVQYLIRWLS